eukprot:m.180051 g.180051  ORF g.180051 m.180051 type:complete len:220 (-) comp9989_c1_seq9:250-909(-)
MGSKTPGSAPAGDDVRITLLPTWVHGKHTPYRDSNIVGGAPSGDKADFPEKIRKLLGLAALPVLFHFGDFNLVLRPDGIQLRFLLTHEVWDLVGITELFMKDGEPNWLLFERDEFLFWESDDVCLGVCIYAAEEIEMILIDGRYHLNPQSRKAKFTVVCGICTRGERHAHEAECGRCKRRIEVRDACPMDMVSICTQLACPTVLPDGQACPGRRNQDFR